MQSHGNRQKGPPAWQSEYDLMNADSCAPEKLPICFLGLTSLPSGKRNADGTPTMEEYTAVATTGQPRSTKREAMNACFQLVHDNV